MTASTCLKPTALHASGHGHLRVGLADGLSKALESWASAPLKLLVPNSRGLSVWAYLSSFGGGLVAGDQTSVDVNVGPNSRCYLSTQASTKVYRNPSGLACSHRLHATIESGGLLIALPDPIQCYSQACYEQRQSFDLAPSAGLVVLDSLCSGRTERGERWDFTRYSSRTEIRVGGRLVVLDSIHLSAEDGIIGDAMRVGPYRCFATLTIVGDALRSASDLVIQHFVGAGVLIRPALFCIASPVQGGVLLRIAGLSHEEVARALQEHLQFLSGLLGDHPWSRKW